METERAQIGQKRVTADQWDVDGWQMLASEAQKSPLELAKPVYERLVTQFPPFGKFWKLYAEHLSKETPKNHDDIQKVYERAVKVAPTSIDLWLSYVSFASSLARDEPGSKMEAEAIKVYERALTAAGLDLAAIPLWSHYLDFVKNHTTQSDIHRRDALRRVYQRAVRNPMQQVDTLWREYTEFEQKNNNNKEFARGVISENQPKNIDARTEFRARRSRREGLTLHVLPVPPRGRAKETSQAQQWRRFITQESGNPHALAAPELHVRVVHAYECALAPLYRYPDVWIEYLSYVYKTLVNNPQLTAQRGGGGKEGVTNAKDDTPGHKAAGALEPLLERAIKALPDNIALHIHVNWVYVRIGMPAKGVAALDTMVKRYPSPLAYIHLMRAVRKADGRDPARKVFSRARKDPKGNDPAVYVAAALMEFTVSRDSKVARNVFEFGLKNHPSSALVAKEYVSWLWGLGDLEYTRVILKKVMPNVKGDPQDVRDLWERWIALEESIGDAASVDQVEEMWRESDESRVDTVVQEVARRSRFLRFEGFGENDLAAIGGVRNAGAESAIGGVGSQSGKRDPRTGRRVVSSGNRDGNSSANQGRRSNGSGNGSTLRQAKEWVQKLANSLPVIDAPPPAVEVLFQMLLETPDEFGDTPAGASGRTTARGKAWSDPVVGKKRKSDEVVQSKDGSAGATAPEHDVFRARQAAKQSRKR